MMISIGRALPTSPSKLRFAVQGVLNLFAIRLMRCVSNRKQVSIIRQANSKYEGSERPAHLYIPLQIRIIPLVVIALFNLLSDPEGKSPARAIYYVRRECISPGMPISDLIRSLYQIFSQAIVVNMSVCETLPDFAYTDIDDDQHRPTH
jgi:hypothetical protein